MSAMIASATAMPGVRSSSICTAAGSMASRAAWRYSSRRCADTSTLTTMAIVSPSRYAARLLARELRTVVIGRIAIDGMNVVHAVLRRVLDDEGWPLDPEVRRTAVGRRATPGEVGLRQVRPDLCYARFAERVGHDAGPLPHELHQHRLLRRRERGRTNAFGLNGSSILTGSEHEI